MSCPKCATGLLVIERVSVAGGLTFEQWRCINCGKRMDQEDEMTRSAESIAKQMATRAAKKAEKAEAQFQAGYAEPKESPPITHVRPRLAVVDRPAPPLGPDLPGVWDDGEDKPNGHTISLEQLRTIETKLTTETALKVIDRKIGTYREAIAVLESAKKMLVA